MNIAVYNVHLMNTPGREESLTLEILQTIEKRNNVTQRHLADHMDIALGLANSYLKRCVRKGLVKIQQVPANRYLYYLTPKGFAEKSRLTAAYLKASFDFYHHASDSLADVFRQCRNSGIRRILFCGVSELAEIASLRATEHGMVIVGTFDPHIGVKKFLHLPVWQSLDDADTYDACLLTSLAQSGELYAFLGKQLEQDRILIPSILGINTIKPESNE